MARPRDASLDILRGLIMVFMAIDHVREGQTGPGRSITDPMDLANTPGFVFFWRLLAHFCAPCFTLLLGISAYLSRATPAHLFTRGLVLLALEFTVVNWAWTFNPLWPRLFWQVIAALGCSLIALSLAIRWPRPALAATGLLLIGGHNLLDALHFTPGTPAHFLWSFLHDRNVLPLFAGFEIRTSYPVLPNLGLALCGYALAPLLQGDRRLCAQLGFAALALFLLLRATNLYGDPHPFDGSLRSFFNVTKYPHSLQFILFTTGPALLFLSAARSWRQPWLEQLGRTPMFFYLAHLYLIHALGLAAALALGLPIDFARYFGGLPPGLTLPAWAFGPAALLICAILYPLCRCYEPRRLKYL